MTGVDASALRGRGRLGVPPIDGNRQIDGLRPPDVASPLARGQLPPRRPRAR